MPAGRSSSREGEAAAALIALRRSFALWQELEVALRGGARTGRWSGSRAALSATTTPPRSSSSRRAGLFARPGRRAGPRARRRARPTGDKAGAHGLTARELEVLRLVAAGQQQPGDRRGAGDQRAHRRAPPAEHLREARRLLANRGERVRVRARSRLTRSRVVRNDHAAAVAQVGEFRR